MGYRSVSKYHKIRTRRPNKQIPYETSWITTSCEAAKKFKGVVMQEVLLKDSILLVKSGCGLDIEGIAKALI